MGFSFRQKVVDISGAEAIIVDETPDKKGKVAIRITKDSPTGSAMTEGNRYMVPENQLRKK